MDVMRDDVVAPRTPHRLERMLLVEDSRIFADLLADRMRREHGVSGVDIASSVSEAHAYIRRARPDLIFLDLNLGRESGVDLFIDLDRMPDPPRVLMLSGSDDVNQVVRTLRAGADGWVSKTAAFEDLMLAAHEVIRGNMYLTPTVLGRVIRSLLEADSGEASFIDMLSARQVEVLRCVAAGMSRAECAAHLHISVNTVRTHVQQLLKRADVHSTLALATLARDLDVPAIVLEPARDHLGDDPRSSR